MRFSIVIPCYNERGNIEGLLAQFAPLGEEFDLELVLVENGSTDGSAEYFRSRVEGRLPWVRTAYVPANRGYGYGIQQGLKLATGDYAGWMHADLQLRPGELAPFLRYASRHAGERLYLQGRRAKRSGAEQLFMYGESLACSIAFGMRLVDVPAMPILFHRSLLDGVDVDAMPDDFSIDIYVHALARGRGFAEKRRLVEVAERASGRSAWNRGLASKVRLGAKIIADCAMIRAGRKVLA